MKENEVRSMLLEMLGDKAILKGITIVKRSEIEKRNELLSFSIKDWGIISLKQQF